MMTTSIDILHDKINLWRLLRRLEKSTAPDASPIPEDTIERIKAWSKAQSNLQLVRHAREMLENLESAGVDMRSDTLNPHDTVERAQNAYEGLVKRLEPTPKRRAPILPTLPLPQPADAQPVSPTSETSPPPEMPPEAILIPAEPIASAGPGQPSRPLASLRLSSSEASILGSTSSLSPPESSTRPTSNTLVSRASSTSASTASTSTSIPRLPALATSTALQSDMSEQLFQMAQQLKRNMEHFNTSLADDRAVLEGADEKLGSNYETMKGTRTRLKERSAASSGMTWTVVLAVLVAAVAFVLTFLIIRIT